MRIFTCNTNYKQLPWKKKNQTCFKQAAGQQRIYFSLVQSGIQIGCSAAVRSEPATQMAHEWCWWGASRSKKLLPQMDPIFSTQWHLLQCYWVVKQPPCRTKGNLLASKDSTHEAKWVRKFFEESATNRLLASFSHYQFSSRRLAPA